MTAKFKGKFFHVDLKGADKHGASITFQLSIKTDARHKPDPLGTINSPGINFTTGRLDELIKILQQARACLQRTSTKDNQYGWRVRKTKATGPEPAVAAPTPTPIFRRVDMILAQMDEEYLRDDGNPRPEGPEEDPF